MITRLLPLVALFALSTITLNQAFGQCNAEAGTITVNDNGGGTVPFVVCFGESVDVTTDNNFILPPSGPNPDMVYLFYSCPPTDPDPTMDACWTGWFWTGSDFQTVNNGSIQDIPAIPNTFILVPIVVDNNNAPNGIGIDADGDGCWDINPDDTETFTFLNEIEINELNVDDCTGEVIVEITGGYPELFPPAQYMISNTGGGVLTQSGADGGTITISGLMDGESYSFSLFDDGNGCSATYSGGTIDQMLSDPVLAYDPFCPGSSGFPTISAPSGGDFSFVSPPGDGASIDPSTGELSNVMGSYEIEYVDNSGCAPTSTTFTITITPPPPPPNVNTLYELCESDNTVVSPDGIGDFFSLYSDQFGGSSLEEGQGFDMLNYVNPGDPEAFFWVSQTVDDCESERVEFSVIIYGDDRPSIDPIIMVCEGSSVTLEPISNNGNSTAEFNFYGNSSLTDLLFFGETYTFTPTENTSIYITEQNGVCESAPEEVEIILESPPTATFAEPDCYSANSLYSIVVTTNAANIVPSSGFAVDNGDGTFTIFDVASGDFLDLTLENSTADCNTLIELPEFDCGCIPPAPPVSGGNVTICAGDVIPALTVTVGAGETADWYDAATGGTLLLAGSTSFTPPGAGIYFAETHVIFDDCLSTTRTAVSLTIDPVPVLVSSMVNCAPDLLTYTVDLQFNDANDISVNAGTITNNSGGSFTVSGIPVGTNLTYTAEGVNINCTLGPETITSPACPCPAVNTPTTANQNISICPGDPIPTLSVNVDPGLTADWYDAASGGTLLANNTLTFTPTATGTYFVEAQDPVNSCVSTRLAITITTSPAPSYVLLDASCAADLMTYTIQLTLTNADQLMTNAGTIMNNGGGNFSVSGIPAGMDVQITITSTTTTCSLTDMITAPDCSCAPVDAPISNGDQTICAGDPIPPLTVTVGAGETVDWYDMPTGGTLLLAGNTSFTPTMAGTYFAETRVMADGCTSNTRTAVSLTIDATPSLVSTMANCAPDLLTYSVDLQINDANSLTVNTGSVTNNGGGSFTISNIMVGTNLTYTALGLNASCTFGPETVTSPLCPCPMINDPLTNQTVDICAGEPIPTLTATVDPGLTADWYDAPVGGTLLAGSSLTFTPTVAGTYYVEARDPVNNCVSSRIEVVFTINPIPSFTVNDVSCALDLLTYSIEVDITDADQLLSNAGTITNNGGGNYTVSGITAGMDVELTVNNTTTTCSLIGVVTSPDCNCAAVNPPLSGGDQSICEGAMLPNLTVSVGAGETVDWYDMPTDGTLLLGSSNTFSPTMAGTYYAETRVIADGCVSSVRTAVTLTINPQPAFVSFDTICAADLLTYSVELSLTNTISIDVNAGAVADLGGGNFSIIDIPAGMNFTYTAFNSDMSCSIGPLTIDAPICPCPTIADPIPGMVASICPGDAIPELTVMTEPGLTANWYDDPVAGNLVASSTLSFTPVTDGSFYVEAIDPINNCTSNRVEMTIVTNPTPAFFVNNAACAADLMTYTVDLTVTDADMVMVNAGMIMDNGGGNYTISNIPAGTNLDVDLENSTTACDFSDTVIAPDCSCGVINPPVSGGDISVCSGDPIPDLVATPAMGETVDWYDMPTGGTLLAMGTTAFTTAMPGTYYAETRVVADGCISFSRTAVTLTINDQPVINNFFANCAPNLLTYTVNINTTDAASLQADLGMVINNGGGDFSIVDIPVNMDVTFTAFNSDMSCSAGPQLVTAPDCSCPTVNPPVGNGDVAVCFGNTLPDLSVSVGTDETADWYDAATGGTLLLGGSLTFTPPGPGSYFVETRNTIHNCTSERIEMVATVNPLPSFVLQDTVCSADLLTYQVDILVMDGDEVLPSNGVLVDNGGGNFSITGIPSGVPLNFTLNNTVTGCTNTGSVVAPDCSCDPIAAPVSDGDITICSTEQIPALSVSVNADETVDWYDTATGGNLLLENSNTFTPLAAGTYFAETRQLVTNCISNERTAVSLTINPTPTMVIDNASCAPDLLTYSIEVTTTDAASITADLGTITDNGGGSYTVSAIPANMDVTVTAFNFDMSCSVGPETVMAPDCSCPTIPAPTSNGDMAICAGDPIPVLSVMVSGDEQTADWYDAATGGTLLLEGSLTFTPPGPGTYFVEERNGINNCVSERISITLTENPLPSFVVVERICSPDLLTYNVQLMVMNANELIVNEGTVIDNDLGNFTVEGISAGTALEITLTNTTTTCSIMATIAAPDCSCDPVVEPVSNGDVSICMGEDLPALSVEVSDGETVDWYDAAMGGSLLLEGNTTFQPTSAGTYFAETRVVISNCVSTIRTAVSLIIFENPGLIVSETMEPGCTNDDGEIILTASGGLAPYEFRINGGDWQTLTNFTGLGVGDYSLEIQDANGCMASTEQTLSSPAAVVVTFTADGILTCDNMSVMLDATGSSTGNDISYQWIDPTGEILPDNGLIATATIPGEYELIVTNSQTNCVNAVEVVVNDDFAVPNANAGEDGLITCDFETANLLATSTTAANLSFSWSALDGGTIDGNTNQAGITVSAGGNYEVTITNTDNGCSSTDIVFVEEIINTEIDLNITAQDPSCLGDENGSIILEAADPASMLLFASEGEAFSLNNSFLNLSSGTYTFQVQDEFGCEVSTSVVLNQGTDIILDVGENAFIKLGDSVDLDPILVNVNPSDLASIQWTNGQFLNCDTCLVTSTMSTMATSNTFSLTVVDSLGCNATDELQVFVDRERNIYVPNAFSPDDDGNNDFLFVSGGKDIAVIESFSVFDRWGEPVFEKFSFQPNDPSCGWDGTYRNQQQLNAAVFVYMVEVRFIDGEVEVFTGDVVLLR